MVAPRRGRGRDGPTAQRPPGQQQRERAAAQGAEETSAPQAGRC